MTKDSVTLRDIMALTKEINATVNSIEEKLNKKIDDVDCRVDTAEKNIAVLDNKISNLAKLQLSISVILSTIATWLGAGGLK